MLLFIFSFFFGIVRNLFLSKGQLHLRCLVLEKQLQIAHRTLKQRGLRPQISVFDRFHFSLFAPFRKSLGRAFILFQPDTLLRWYRHFLRLRWLFPYRKPGRKAITKTIKSLVLTIKRLNPWFGLSKIQGELSKNGIDLGRTSIQRILHEFRRNGKLQPWGSWKTFLKAHWESLFACDFLTVDTAFGKRLFVFFIEELKSRSIVHWGVTDHPTTIFIQQQILSFQEKRSAPIHLIHDRGPELMAFRWDYYGITDHPTCVASPNLNAYAERFAGTLRRECLDRFLILGQRQLKNLIRAYVEYYNTRRPHQGIGNTIPSGSTPISEGTIRSRSLCFGLVHDFYRNVG